MSILVPLAANHGGPIWLNPNNCLQPSLLHLPVAQDLRPQKEGKGFSSCHSCPHSAISGFGSTSCLQGLSLLHICLNLGRPIKLNFFNLESSRTCSLLTSIPSRSNTSSSRSQFFKITTSKFCKLLSKKDGKNFNSDAQLSTCSEWRLPKDSDGI